MTHPFTDFLLPLWMANSSLIPIYHWILLNTASKYQGMGLRFFETRMRTFITSEGIGLLGTLVNFILVPDDAQVMLFLTFFMLPITIMITYASHVLRIGFEAQQAEMEIDKQPSNHNEDSISQN